MRPKMTGWSTLRELGRLERTLFTLDWIEDPDLHPDTANSQAKRGHTCSATILVRGTHRLAANPVQ